MVFYKFLVFSTKTHVRFKISISQLKLPQNLIITYQNLLSPSWITCNLFSCDNCPSFSARLNQRGVLFFGPPGILLDTTIAFSAAKTIKGMDWKRRLKR